MATKKNNPTRNTATEGIATSSAAPQTKPLHRAWRQGLPDRQINGTILLATRDNSFRRFVRITRAGASTYVFDDTGAGDMIPATEIPDDVYHYVIPKITARVAGEATNA